MFSVDSEHAADSAIATTNGRMAERTAVRMVGMRNLNVKGRPGCARPEGNHAGDTSEARYH